MNIFFWIWIYNILEYILDFLEMICVYIIYNKFYFNCLYILRMAFVKYIFEPILTMDNMCQISISINIKIDGV